MLPTLEEMNWTVEDLQSHPQRISQVILPVEVQEQLACSTSLPVLEVLAGCEVVFSVQMRLQRLQHNIKADGAGIARALAANPHTAQRVLTLLSKSSRRADKELLANPNTPREAWVVLAQEGSAALGEVLQFSEDLSEDLIADLVAAGNDNTCLDLFWNEHLSLEVMEGLVDKLTTTEAIFGLAGARSTPQTLVALASRVHQAFLLGDTRPTSGSDLIYDLCEVIATTLSGNSNLPLEAQALVGQIPTTNVISNMVANPAVVFDPSLPAWLVALKFTSEIPTLLPDDVVDKETFMSLAYTWRGSARDLAEACTLVHR